MASAAMLQTRLLSNNPRYEYTLAGVEALTLLNDAKKLNDAVIVKQIKSIQFPPEYAVTK